MSERERRIRLWCEISSRKPAHLGPHDVWWGEFAFAYAQALTKVTTVRILPCNHVFMGPGALPLGYEHWETLLEHFTGPVAPSYVNVVCAYGGLTMGRTELATEDHPESGIMAGEPIYRAGRVITDLYTPGRANVAITGHGNFSEEEIAFLADGYNFVLCPTRGMAENLRALSNGLVEARVVPPSSIADWSIFAERDHSTNTTEGEMRDEDRSI